LYRGLTIWLIVTFLLRGDFFPQYTPLFAKLTFIAYGWTALQFYFFISSFFASGEGRWLPFAYVSLAVVIALVGLNYLAIGVTASGEGLYLEYGTWIFVLIIPLLILGGSRFGCWHRLTGAEDSPREDRPVFLSENL
jgi:hypothetical protein